jgi:hypothetical protein
MSPSRASAACAVTLMIAAPYSPILLAQGYPPAQAAGKMTLPSGFRATLVASEPEVRQPVAIDFDERGRLWVMQYLQYPNPAGLKRVKVDRYSRTVYDRVPEPPPKGPKGADRLTILRPDPDYPGKFKPPHRPGFQDHRPELRPGEEGRRRGGNRRSGNNRGPSEQEVK